MNNTASQLLVIQSVYSSESNCYDTGGPGELVAEFYPYFDRDRHKTLAEYQRVRRQDLSSRAGGCGALPAKVDVHRLHVETLAYAERARALLSGGHEGRAGGSGHRWLEWLLGR